MITNITIADDTFSSVVYLLLFFLYRMQILVCVDILSRVSNFDLFIAEGIMANAIIPTRPNGSMIF